MEFHHKPVLFEETIQSLAIRPEGLYIDGTMGGGGHSEAIVKQLTTGRLLSIDQDPDAMRAAGERLGKYPQSVRVRGNFAQMGELARAQGMDAVDGVLLDIGVSSYQLDTPERGFSYHHDAPLDMRMSQEGPTARDLVNTLSQQELADIIFRYGEDKSARRIAQGIVQAREEAPIETTAQLAEIVKASGPGGGAQGRGPSRPADLPGPADRRERRAGPAPGGAGGGLRAAEARRPPGGDHLPFPGGPHRQAADAPVVPGLCLPQGLPRVRLRAASPRAGWCTKRGWPPPPRRWPKTPGPAAPGCG